MKTLSIVEEQFSPSQAYIVSHNSLLTTELEITLQNQQLNTHLYHLSSATNGTSDYSRVHSNKKNTDLNQLKLEDADYLFYLYPSLAAISPSEHERFFHSVPLSCKIVLIDNFRHQAAIDQLNPLLRRKDYRVILLTDVYGQFVPPLFANPILTAISRIFQHQPLEIEGTGQNLLYPTYSQDVVKGIVKAVFGANTRSRVYFISTLESITQIDLANRLKLHSSEILDFTPPIEYFATASSTPTPDVQQITSSQAELNWTPDSDLDATLCQTLAHIKELCPKLPLPLDQSSHHPPTPKPNPPVSLPSLRPLIPSKIGQPLLNRTPNYSRFGKRKRALLFIGLTLILILTLPFLVFYFSAVQGAQQLDQAYGLLGQGSHQQAKDPALLSQRSLGRARVALGLLKKTTPFLPQAKYEKYDQLLDAGSRLGGVISITADTLAKADRLYAAVLSTDTTNFQQTNSDLKTSLDSLYHHLSLVQASIDQTDLSSSMPSVKHFRAIKSQLPHMRATVEQILGLVNLLPQLIAHPQPQTFLILVKNNLELRPAGGLISVIGLFTFTDGRLTSFQTNDAFAFDHQFNGVVVPPPAIQSYLGETNWFLRDSNWSPDFPASAQQAQWFINKGLNRKVDGVVALDLHFIQSLLKATGPIDLPNRGTPVTAENLFELVLYGNELDSTASSPQHNQFLVSLFDTLITKLRDKQLRLPAFAQAVSTSLLQNHLLIYSNQPNVQSVLTAQNWAGTVNNPPCPPRFNQQNCTIQTFSLVEANLGVNRSNFFLDRRFNHELTIGNQGQIDHSISVEYQNNSSNNSWPAGRYKTYTRLYAPLHIQLLKTTLGEQELEPVGIVPNLDLGLQEISYLYDIPAATQLTLNISLRSSQILNLSNPPAALAINWEKQSGTDADPITLTINHPLSLNPAQISQPGSVQAGKTTLHNQLLRDLTFALQF